MTDFATVLRNRRQALGMTQVALALEMSTVQSHISELETHACQPTLPVLHRWADALGFDVKLVDRGDS